MKRSGSKVSLWGLVRPGRRRDDGDHRDPHQRWLLPRADHRKTDARGYFTKSAAFDAKGAQWRLVWTAPDGTTFRGSPTRAYK